MNKKLNLKTLSITTLGTITILSIISIKFIFNFNSNFIPHASPIKNLPKFQKIIFITTNKYNGNLGGISGADAICQKEAYGVKTSKIMPGLKFKALLITNNRYPCDSTGNCGIKHMYDWPLTASVKYYNPDKTLFNKVNNNYVFDGSKTVFQFSNAISESNNYWIWSGVQSIKYSNTTNDISAWAYTDENATRDKLTYLSNLANCNNFTDGTINITGSVGITGTYPSWNGNSNKPSINEIWGNYYDFNGSEIGDSWAANIWSSGGNSYCSEYNHFICVSI